MSETSTPKSITPLHVAIDLVLCSAFFVLIYTLVSGHVQSKNPLFVVGFGVSTAACMSVVFWLCIQMFRVVLKAQLDSRAKH